MQRLTYNIFFFLGNLSKHIQQASFAAHNLEDVAIYDADKERCYECERFVY